jgi:hypothetical protein
MASVKVCITVGEHYAHTMVRCYSAWPLHSTAVAHRDLSSSPHVSIASKRSLEFGPLQRRHYCNSCVAAYRGVSLVDWAL